ncbi:hypothetical protein COV16_05225 [Candidatus Woesearchaeota archaeon CG10_big_fil_rev_8_21_14_0_10_34_8]|nr:MAG: hypothetical protein COV16_05225 [Candidatus Woesearchaeota archaeon CG10_big_fil_rev_8_21_14_0_10_34_8]
MDGTELLEIFCRRRDKYLEVAGVQAVSPIDFSLRISPTGKEKDPPHLTIGVGVHGDEIQGVQALNQILDESYDALANAQQPVLFVVGNPEAVKLQRRYKDADLNRQFSKGSIDATVYESKRAAELERAVQGTRYLLDVHSTIAPTRKPYGIFPNRVDLVEFMHHLGTDISDIILVDILSPEKGMCFDEHLYFTDPKCTPITIEVGCLSDGQSAVDRARNAIYGALHYTGVIPGEVSLQQYPTLWEEAQKVPNSKDSSLVLDLVNFQPVEKGFVLGYKAETPITSEYDGIIIFPRYNNSNVPTLVRIAVQKAS